MRSFLVALQSCALVALTLLTTTSTAHSWVEELDVIAPNGTFTGAPGYARGNVQRAAGVDPDKGMVHLLPPNGRPEGNQILDSDPMCMPSQQSQTQSSGSPALQAAPGSFVALRYQENGHVTLPANQPGKPANRGSVYIYGTTQSKPDDKFLAIHKVWNADGTGGDKRGKLLATQNFDDGQCYQVNGGQISTARQAQFKHVAAQPMGQDLWCQNNIAIPSDVPTGKPYTLYWVWQWDTSPNTPGVPLGKNESYTTCIDVDMTGNTGSNAKDANAVKFVEGQSLNEAAIPSYMSALAQGSTQASSQPTSPPASASPPASSAPPTSAAAAAPQVLSSSVTSAAPPPPTVTVTAKATPITVTVTAGAPAPISQVPSSTTVVTVPGSTVQVPAATQSSNPQPDAASEPGSAHTFPPVSPPYGTATAQKRSNTLGSTSHGHRLHKVRAVNGKTFANRGSAKFRKV